MLAVQDIRRVLSQKLPSFMIPSAFVFLTSIPLTANGKVARQELPAPNYEEASTVAFVAPRDSLESTFINLVSSILGVSKIGMTDNFFDLGVYVFQWNRVVCLCFIVVLFPLLLMISC